MRAQIATLLTALALPLAAQAATVAEWKFDGDANLSWAKLYVDPNGAKAKLSLEAAAAAAELESGEDHGTLKIEVLESSSDGKSTDIQFWIAKDDGIAAGKYRLTVLIKGSAVAEKLPLGFIQGGEPYAHFAKPGGMSLDIDTEWKTLTLDFEALPGFDGERLRMPCFFLGALPKGYTLWIASVKLENSSKA